jgi:tetratricopeptide (TPR) repeat protein
MANNANSINKLMEQAQACERAGKMAEAEGCYRRIIADDPKFHPAFHALGLLAYGAGNLPLAADLLKAAIALDKKVALYQRNYGEMCRRLGLLDAAIAAGRQTVKLAPADLDAHYNLGLAYSDAKDFEPAIVAYRRAIKLDARHGLSWNNLGSAMEQQGDKDAAELAYARAVELNPQHAEAQNNLGAIDSERGKLDDARACFAAAIAAKPEFVEAHYNLSSLKTYQKDDPHLALLEGVYANRASLTDHARIRYCFALGKALDDTGEYDRAFTAYEEGNRVQHALLPMDERQADSMLDNIIRVFDDAFFAARKPAVPETMAGRSPIFIVGMPRSGTTLLEQILCSHASVYGAGELVNLSEVIAALTGAGKPFTDTVAGLSAEDMRRLGEEYVKRVWMLSPDSAYITDKMPANYFYLGLIHLALPNARIIHAMRDPMDSCFSCYSRLFNDTMEFAYDQGTLGRYYVRYMKLMQHWHKVLPEGRILDLRYEEMVADTEKQARRVLEFVGLPWDENCLQFHKNDRLVKTASVAQVRRPIYKTSVSRWKHFARHLRPLFELVKDYRPVDPDMQLMSQDNNLTERCLSMQGRNENEQVVELLTRHVQSGAASPQIWHLLGISLYRLCRFAEAKAAYEKALALQPDFHGALNSLGFLLQDMGQVSAARDSFARSIELVPEFAMARLNLGMAQLKLGEWQAGWENYEARWTGSAESGSGSFMQPACPLPQWNGEQDTGGQSLLVITEQGFGDTFQFSRYLKLATQRFAKVGFVCAQPTMRLMEWAFGNQVVLLARMPADYATWDWQCSLMSLPRAFMTRPETIPAEPSYLIVPKVAQQHWLARLDNAAPGRFRIGIAWAGRKAHQFDARRSLRFDQILPLLQDERISWVSLQKWAADEARPVIPAQIDWLDWTEELTDFADTAALVVNLDLVISIDSSMVHLAGALGRPVWMMNRFDGEWRWLESRRDSPWYQTLRIFNQPKFGDWSSVLTDVENELTALPIPDQPRTLHAPKVMNQRAQPEPVSLDQAMQVASAHQSAGRLQEAERILQLILQSSPENAHALHLLGVVAHQANRPKLATDLIAKAIAIDTDVALFHSNMAEMCRQQGRLDEAIRHGERAVALEPTLASAHSNLGVALYDAKEYDRAETCHLRALALVPGMLQSLNNLGSIERARKNKSGAEQWYRQALLAHPDYLESLSNLGAVLVEADRADEAVPVLENALRLNANYPEALCNLGLARLKQDRIEQAVVLLQRSLQLKPDYPEAMIGLARALSDQDRLPEAEALLRQLNRIAPRNTDAWCQLGSLLMEAGEADQSRAAFESALAIDPELSDALSGLGNLQLEAGKIDEAEQLLKRAIAIDPDCVGARFHLVQVKKVKAGDDNLACLIDKLSMIDTLPQDQRVSLHYALGKAYDDLKEYDLAFPHFMAGANIKRGKLYYDADVDAARTYRITQVADRAFIKRLKGAGDPSDLPVFVLGMPRSGTTLTEQIIASHPEVHGAGELRDLMDIVQRQESSNMSYPDNLSGLDKATLTSWGRDYVARLRARAPDARRITDKMPANYMALGLIPLMLPGAKIIHVKRNPVDTCVSCFTRLFNRHQDATYDLAELGQHYVDYTKLMEHWKSVLPADAFIEVQYEDIVADMEGQARRLIEFCGLQWNDSCLDFHKNTRNIRTASVTQVRQPIYNSSVERWRHYEKFLSPLLDELGGLVPGSHL